MKIVQSIISALFGDDNSPTMITGVMADKPDSNFLSKARAKAAKRHGKPFRCDIRKPRETEASHDLAELRDKTKPAAPASSKVTVLDRRKGK